MSLLKQPSQIQSPTRPAFRWNFMDPGVKIPPCYAPKGEADRTLVFESRFESGNLGLAAKLSDHEYRLVMQCDTLTHGNTQCILVDLTSLGFYFRVSNTTKGLAVRFHIVNFVLNVRIRCVGRESRDRCTVRV